MVVKKLKSSEFDVFIKKGKVVVDFWAEWCGPCKMTGPIFEAASKKIKDVKFGSVNVDEETEVTQKLGIMGLPTIMYFKDGKQVDQSVGAILSEKDMIERIKDAFK